jgi:hypothetical protein
MRWHGIFFKLSLFAVLALLLANPAAARGNATSGIYPGTVKDICVGDTIFVGETGLNLTPLTPYANGSVQKLKSYVDDNPDKDVMSSINIPHGNNFDVPPVTHYGIYYPVVNGNNVLRAYPIQIQPAIPRYTQNVVITSSKDWVVADGIDSALLTITVTDGGTNPIPGADLVMSAGTPWGLRDSALKTDGSGKAQTLFLPTTKSGAAVITASATVNGVTTAPVTTTLLQNIDAGTPYSGVPLYPSTATVGSPTGISVLIMDRYGNPVTSRRAMTNVSFVTASNGMGFFQDGMGNQLKAVSVPLNETGWAEVTYMVGTLQGNNFVYITLPAPLSSSLINIVGIGDSKPFSITQSVIPVGDPPFILADNSSYATIDYYLFDQWGNPSSDQGIQIVTSAGENRIFYTNQEGRATILYGSKRTAGFYSITATAVGNSDVRISQTLEFGSLDPKDMLLTASPQTMASLDSPNSTKVGHVIGKVIDEKGNPVKGQTVTFWIGKSDSSPYVRTRDPAIGNGGVTTADIGARIPAITNENGQAIIDYYPGAFLTWSENQTGIVGYNDQAQGKTTINALWTAPDGTEKNSSIDLSYKNYPFLSVYTEVNPKTVQAGDRVDVSVRLKGDGWALQPNPIDVVLCTDRSSTMLINESIVNGKLFQESLNDRMVDAMNAATAFVNQTTPGRDRIGLISFANPAAKLNGRAVLFNASSTSIKTLYLGVDDYAWRAGPDYNCTEGQPCTDSKNRDNLTDKRAFIMSAYPGHGSKGKDYSVNATSSLATGVYLESPLTYDKTQITKAINSMVPSGGTPMRRALYYSVKQIINDPEVIAHKRDSAVRAIVLLTDGYWGLSGDPRGIVNSIFGFESYDGPGEPGTGSLITWAKSNNIKIFTIALVGGPNSTSTSDQANVNELKAYADETGGKAYVANTGQDLKKSYIDIAGKLRVEASVDTKVALDFSTMEVNGNATIPGTTAFQYEHNDRSTYIVPPRPGTPYTVDNTTDWANGRVTFSAGTIKLDEEWVVNFTLRALTEGNIKVLSSKSSKITFNGTEGEVGIPDTYITAVPPGIEKGPEGIACSFTNIRRTDEASNTQIAQLAWDPEYNGRQPTINWTVGLAPPYSIAYTWQDPFGKYSDESPVTYPLIIKDLKPGSYTVKIVGRVSDASDCLGPTYQLIIPEPTTTAQILIQ